MDRWACAVLRYTVLFALQVSSDVLALYNIVETNFRPMSIVKDSQPHLQSLTKTGGDVARCGTHTSCRNIWSVWSSCFQLNGPYISALRGINSIWCAFLWSEKVKCVSLIAIVDLRFSVPEIQPHFVWFHVLRSWCRWRHLSSIPVNQSPSYLLILRSAFFHILFLRFTGFCFFVGCVLPSLFSSFSVLGFPVFSSLLRCFVVLFFLLVFLLFLFSSLRSVARFGFVLLIF